MRNIILKTSFGLIIFLNACSYNGSKKNQQMKKATTTFSQGTYGYDVAFFKDNNIETIELNDEVSGSCVLIIPAYQGRVMTSSANGAEGASFGWINYGFISEGKISSQFNPFGGEERFWLGPEGGPWSIYFKPGDEQVFSNWKVPEEIDTLPFKVEEKSDTSAVFTKSFELVNYTGTTLKTAIERTVRILSKDEVESTLNLSLDASLKFVAFESENILTNKGDIAWNETNGALSIWMLCMFNPSEEGVVFIPFKMGSAAELGKIVTDDYFGKVPSDRLIVKDGILFFKTDGKYRSKIGIPPLRALPLCGSYDPKSQVLTLLSYSQPEGPLEYVNSVWGRQDDPLSGDVVNSYNDGPVEDGSVMGPFYEIESSSPAAMLEPGARIIHTQRIYHISGDESDLNYITEKLFNVSIGEIKRAF